MIAVPALRHFSALGFACCLLLTGCGGETILAVKGKVTIKGGASPARATVVFADAAKQISSSGTVAEDGTYQLTYKKVNDGAPPGSYVVTVHTASALDSSQGEPPRVFHTKYENPSTSGLTKEVKAGGNYDLELDPPQ
jgi:hypothetical protein